MYHNMNCFVCREIQLYSQLPKTRMKLMMPMKRILQWWISFLKPILFLNTAEIRKWLWLDTFHKWVACLDFGWVSVLFLPLKYFTGVQFDLQETCKICVCHYNLFPLLDNDTCCKSHVNVQNILNYIINWNFVLE